MLKWSCLEHCLLQISNGFCIWRSLSQSQIIVLKSSIMLLFGETERRELVFGLRDRLKFWKEWEVLIFIITHFLVLHQAHHIGYRVCILALINWLKSICQWILLITWTIRSKQVTKLFFLGAIKFEFNLFSSFFHWFKPSCQWEFRFRALIHSFLLV